MSAHARHRVARVAAAALIALSLCACGGGGGGGGGGTTGGVTIPAPAANVAALSVDAGPTGTAAIVNTPFVTVTVCVPGTSQCQTIDHVAVDTGSSGLRLIASVLGAPLLAALPARTDAGGNPVGECEQFADGFSWGSVRSADLQVAGESAAGLPVQIIGDPALTEPTACGTPTTSLQTVASFGANGLLGVGVFRQDCGPGCAPGVSSIPPFYFSCPGGTNCVASTLDPSLQVQNPVWRFATDNNGVIVLLPPVDPAGAALVNGALVFGIDTEGNNALGNAVTLHADPNTGYFTVQFAGASFPSSSFDSGSSAIYFDDAALPTCPSNTIAPGYYCPQVVQNLTAGLQGAGGGTLSTVGFSIANANALLGNNTGFFAYGNLGAPNPVSAQYFTFGLPFFFGRGIYVAIEGQATSAGTGPFEAYR